MIASKHLALNVFLIACAMSTSRNALCNEHDIAIEYLLGAVENSECSFIRNGDRHSGEEAATHLANKYRKAKRHIKSVEQFIDRIATKSFLSGERYMIDCGNGNGLGTAIWLRERLGEFEAKNGQGY